MAYPEQVRIDVMMPFYGDVTRFQQAVHSVLASRHTDFRLVVVDDCYPDPAPARWLTGLADERIVYHRNEKNLGVNGNFRRCVELVEAPRFVVMGCDDLMHTDYLTRVISLAHEAPDAVVVAPGVQVIDDAGRVVHPLADRIKSVLAPSGPALLAGEDLVAGLYRGNWTYFPSLLWTTDAVREQGFRPDLEVVLDLALLTDLAFAGGSLAHHPDVVFSYRRHAGSVSSVRAIDGRRFAEERAFFAGEALRCVERGWTRAAREARWHLTSRLHQGLARGTAVIAALSPRR